MVTLRGIDFGSVFCAPGARGFYGEGYPWHRAAHRLGMTWSGTTFVAKTTTLNPREGNMPLNPDLSPTERVPKCIVVKPLSGHVLNAVGLSGPGAKSLFETNVWAGPGAPFMLSFMSVGADAQDRLADLQHFIKLFQKHQRWITRPVGLQLNFACPNTDHPPAELYAEIDSWLNLAAELGIPLIPNFNPVVPVDVLRATAHNQHCDALWIGNTIPWGDPNINWQRIFGSTESPLRKRGIPADGGLSGPACLPVTIDKIRLARRTGITKPIVAGNGIQTTRNARDVIDAGADGIAIGIVGMMRPWRMRRIIRAGNILARS